MAQPTLPGIDFQLRPRPAPRAPLRSDVAGFLGRTCRGPVGQPVRVEGWRGFRRVFGGLVPQAPLAYAARGYFENGGQIAHVVRLLGGEPQTATALWTIGARVRPKLDDQQVFLNRCYHILASSPGQWGASIRVDISYQSRGPAIHPEFLLTVRAPGEPTEYLRVRIPYPTPQEIRAGQVATLEQQIREQSNLIRAQPDGAALADSNLGTTPNAYRWPRLALKLDTPDVPPATREYADAATLLADEPEVALVAAPGLYCDLSSCAENPARVPPQALDILRRLADDAVRLQDRIVLVDLPQGALQTADVIAAADQMHAALEANTLRRAAAIYHPWLHVPDPLAAPHAPFRFVPPSGHVAGVIARLDRSRGPGHTPANAAIFDAVDLAQLYDEKGGGAIYAAGVNLLLCRPGRGLNVWGGRTLCRDRAGIFLAHRRFLHRLVRAIRAVAEPYVFETNDAKLRRAITRAITSLLLAAFRNGTLQGEQPDQAFFVRCDGTTTPPAFQEDGKLVCEIGLALAVPMEFITLVLAVSQSGQVEVFDR